MIGGLVHWGLKKNRAVISLLVIIFLAGIYTFLKIPKEAFPEVKIPIMMVNVRHEGVSPEDAERLLIQPLEKQLRTIEGLKEYNSTAFEGGAHIRLEFDAGFNSKKAKDEVKDRVDLAKRDLPLESDEPVVTEIDTSRFPVLTLKLSGNVSERTLIDSADHLKDLIEGNISEVLEVKIRGGRKERVEVLIDPTTLENYGINLSEVHRLFRQNNIMVTAGNIDTGKGYFPVKVPGLISNVQDLMDFPVIVNGDKVITFKDISDIRLTYEDAKSYARDRGNQAIALEISKRSGENVIYTIEKVKYLVKRAQNSAGWPPKLEVNYSQDQTKIIQDLLSTLQNNLILALILVLAIIIYAMGWCPSLLVGLAVPGSFLFGTIVISMMGYTMNMVVLFSFILASGMLVDGAIIIVEYADRRMVEGEDRVQAYMEAISKMAVPVLTSVGTIVIVFLPLLFWPGMVGEFMKFMPITLIATLSGSILMALLFMPTLGAMFAKPDINVFEKNKPNIMAIQNCEFHKITGATGQYVRLLSKYLNYPGRTVLAGIGSLAAVLVLYAFFNQGVVFFPDSEPDQARINIRARGDMSGGEKDKLVRQVESKILNMKELKSIYTRTIVMGGSNSDSPPDTIGSIFLEFIDWNKRHPVNKILEDIKHRLKGLPAIKIDISVQQKGPRPSKPIEISISALDSTRLESATAIILKKMESLKGVIDIENNRFLPGAQYSINVDRQQASKYGVTIESLGAMIRLLTTGIKMGSYRPNNKRDEVDIYLRLDPHYRNFDEIAALKIQTKKGPTAISNFVTQGFTPKVGTIRLLNGHRVITIKANVENGHLASDKIAALRKWIKEENTTFPSNVDISFRGEEKDQQESASFLTVAFISAIIFVAFILILQFNSFFNMALVMSSVVMSTIGVFLGLIIHQIPLSIVMGGVSIIALAGIIISNNIILIDTYEEIKDQIKDVKTALLYTCAQRLRPIFLTQITVILGLVPIIFGVNLDFINLDITVGDPATQFWEQFAVCISYGVGFASLLTLFVTPAALLLKHKFSVWWQNNR